MKRVFWLFYFCTVAMACFVVVNDVAVFGMHNWERIVLEIPIGLIIGILEITLFTMAGIFSLLLAAAPEKARSWQDG